MSRQEFPFIKTILPSMRIVEQTVREMMARSNIINISVSTIELLQIDGFESAFLSIRISHLRPPVCLPVAVVLYKVH